MKILTRAFEKEIFFDAMLNYSVKAWDLKSYCFYMFMQTEGKFWMPRCSVKFCPCQFIARIPRASKHFFENLRAKLKWAAIKEMGFWIGKNPNTWGGNLE